jgi:hypothetical protein
MPKFPKLFLSIKLSSQNSVWISCFLSHFVLLNVNISMLKRENTNYMKHLNYEALPPIILPLSGPKIHFSNIPFCSDTLLMTTKSVLSKPHTQPIRWNTTLSRLSMIVSSTYLQVPSNCDGKEKEYQSHCILQHQNSSTCTSCN